MFVFHILLRCYNIWALCVLLQLASVVRSALADKDELTQGDVTAMAATNFFVARMVGSDAPLQSTVLAALVTGYAMRNNVGASSATKTSLHTASVQLASAFLTTSATLGVVAFLAALIPSIPVVGGAIPDVSTLLAVVAMHGISCVRGVPVGPRWPRRSYRLCSFAVARPSVRRRAGTHVSAVHSEARVCRCGGEKVWLSAQERGHRGTKARPFHLLSRPRDLVSRCDRWL